MSRAHADARPSPPETRTLALGLPVPRPPETRALFDQVSRLIVEKLLLEPTEQLKALPDEETQAAYTEAVNRLFRLREGEPVPAPGEGAAEVTPAERHGK